MIKKDSILLNPKEKEIVESIKKYLRTDLKRTEPFICDVFINRYLIARDWNIAKAKLMLSNYFKYRDEMMALMPMYRERIGRCY